MSDDNTQDAAEPSPASAGSQPVAWAVDRGAVYCQLCHTHCDALYVASRTHGSVVFPLYRQPQPALTDEEREAVDTAEASLMRESTDRNTPEPVRQRFAAAVNTLRGLLERTK
jgi:hypothetical protein